MEKLNLFVPLTKVDAAQRLVYLTMTAERPDKSREVMDYATGKPEVQKWSDEIKAASDGASLGNVRLMHTKAPIGKLIDLVFDDENKSVECCVKVVDDAAWALVEERVLTGGSIGGSYLKSWPDPSDRTLTRYTPRLAEFSLVDNPCLPEATFKMVKADGIEEELHFAKHVQAFEPTNDEVKAHAAEMAKTAGKDGVWKDYVAKARAELIKRHAEAPDPADDPAAKLKAALEKAGAPKPYGDVDYADAKGGKYPIDTPAHIRAAWSYVNMPKNAEKLGDQAEAVKAKIVAAWKAKIDKAGPPSAEKAALILDLAKAGSFVDALESVSLEKGFYTVQRLSGAMACLSEIAQSVVCEEAWEKDTDSALPQGMLDLVASTRSILIDMVNEETAEFMACCERDGGDYIALLAPCLDGDVMEMATKLGDLHKADVVLMEKIGAKISGANMKHVQAMHDHATALGATCDSDNAPEAEKLAKGAVELESLRKLAGDAAVTIDRIAAEREADKAVIEKITAEQAADRATLEKLGAVVEHLGRQPQAAKGALFAIEKDGTVIEVATGAKTTGPTFAEQLEAYPVGPERAAFLKKFTG